MFYPIKLDPATKKFRSCRMFGLAVVQCRAEPLEVVSYFHQQGWMASSDGKSAEYPKLYSDVRWALSRLNGLKKDQERYEEIIGVKMTDDIFSLAFWLHDDYRTTPLEKYILLERHFSGCPRQ